MSDGTTLCPIHARQVMTELREPTGVCHPEESWIGGSGQTVYCEFVINPAGVRAWFLLKEERRLDNKARSRWSIDGETP